ncbi:MAG: cytochrome c [Candidatus Omnitrophica bacterium]|nr:cytochrome c [Candidatus Omnitrophota bacterium]
MSQNTNKGRLLSTLAIIGAIGFGAAGCESTSTSSSSNRSNPSQLEAQKPVPDEARVWAENCGRCHNLRSPNEFSYDQWEVIVNHMRVRATLTADETRAILSFLKAAQ